MEDTKIVDFEAIKLRLASPDVIRTWSHGEVTKPETINYRTQKPEKDGLFCEKIFGPTKDWECYCGKYKKIRYKGIVCEKCGVEVTRSLVRRERMGHIELVSPVSHIWFLRSVPSRIGLFLDLSIQDLEKVIYFANFIITRVHEDLRQEALKQIEQERGEKKKLIKKEFEMEVNKVNNVYKVSKVKKIKSEKKKSEGEKKEEMKRLRNDEIKLREEALKRLNEPKERQEKELEEAFEIAQKELKRLKPLTIITEAEFRDLSLKYGHIFEAGIGAEAVRKIFEGVNLDKSISLLEKEIKVSKSLKREKLIRKAMLLKNFKINKIRPEWMILKVLPVIPPDLRPMVPLDGGRFATSDLNDLYRRVINRNNRLKQLVELNAPEVIRRNEKRMLQEAVDALIDNSARHGKTIMASTGQKRVLKSIVDILRGKQGRFRQNLLGKRIDYSGRSVIVVGPYLKLHECGLPKIMALELFKPFIINRLISKGLVHNIRSATRFIESNREEAWDILEEVTRETLVLLNRAPTLHRLSIQAFRPVLIEGKAIQIHPLVCPPFNADFDGDQMAVHVPLTAGARLEAEEIMISKKNLLKPATGRPVSMPNQDMVWGIYYMTSIKEGRTGEMKVFSLPEEAIIAYDSKKIDLQEKVKVRMKLKKSEIIETSVGRILFNKILPDKISFINEVVNKRKLGEIIKSCLEFYGLERTAILLDDLKDAGFKYLTDSGFSWGIDDFPSLKEKPEILKKADEKIDEIENEFEEGLLTWEERHSKIIEVWTEAKDKIVEISKKALSKDSSIFTMVSSGARGSWGQLTQIIGMKGLVINPAGEIIELPVKGSFQEGFDVLEYFISTHGTRKGLSDIALRTANAGYLTRRLVDVSQSITVQEEDCGDEEGLVLTRDESEERGENLSDRIVGRFALETIKDPKTHKFIVKKGELITEKVARILKSINLEKIRIRSLLTCRSLRGVCQRCYGYDLGYNEIVKLGTAVGIIAAQSIGEPGTQLTMRTFHTGGVVGLDITQGLPRVEEIFEVRPPKSKAFITDVSGIVEVKEEEGEIRDVSGKILKTLRRGEKILKIHYKKQEEDEYEIKNQKSKIKNQKLKIRVKDGEKVSKGTPLFINEKGKEIRARNTGIVKISASGGKDNKMKILYNVDAIKEFVIPPEYVVWVKNGDKVSCGDQLTGGNLDLRELYKLKGKKAVQKYIIKEIDSIYSSQGQRLNEKHIELIARQMFSRVYIKEAGDTDFLPGETVEKPQVVEVNQKIMAKKGKPALYNELLLGISKVSLSTESFLSAASFQETAKVLIVAAITGRVDYLRGLKENVIIGRLIPAGTGWGRRSELRD